MTIELELPMTIEPPATVSNSFIKARVEPDHD